MYIRGYIPTPVYIREEEEEEEEGEECVFLRVRREIYTYLRFELTVEVWVGREMGDGEEEEGKGGRGKDGIRSISLSLSFSLSLSPRYAML